MTDNIKLPPLPEGNVAHLIAAQAAEIEALRAERDALAKDAARLKHESAEYIERLEDRLFAAGAMEQAPCFCCGYNGPGYYQPGSHPCAKRHHELRHGVSEI